MLSPDPGRSRHLLLWRLPLIAVVGMIIYGEAIDIFVVLGALLIFAANFMNVRHETRLVTVS